MSKDSMDPIAHLDGLTIKKAKRWNIGKGRHKLVIDFTDGTVFECEASGEYRLTYKDGKHFAWAARKT